MLIRPVQLCTPSGLKFHGEGLKTVGNIQILQSCTPSGLQFHGEGSNTEGPYKLIDHVIPLGCGSTVRAKVTELGRKNPHHTWNQTRSQRLSQQRARKLCQCITRDPSGLQFHGKGIRRTILTAPSTTLVLARSCLDNQQISKLRNLRNVANREESR